MDEDDWEELDENAMEECMVLATQLCSQQPPHCSAATEAENSVQHFKTQYCTSFNEDNGGQSNLINNGSLGNVNDSGVWRSRSSNWNPLVSDSSGISHIPVPNIRNSLHELATMSSTVSQKKEPPQSSYRSRLSNFSTSASNTDLDHGSLTRKSLGSERGLVPLVTRVKGSPSKIKNLGESMPQSTGSEEKAHMLLKTQEENEKLSEKIITMRGEVRKQLGF